MTQAQFGKFIKKYYYFFGDIGKNPKLYGYQINQTVKKINKECKSKELKKYCYEFLYVCLNAEIYFYSEALHKRKFSKHKNAAKKVIYSYASEKLINGKKAKGFIFEGFVDNLDQGLKTFNMYFKQLIKAVKHNTKYDTKITFGYDWRKIFFPSLSDDLSRIAKHVKNKKHISVTRRLKKKGNQRIAFFEFK